MTDKGYARPDVLVSTDWVAAHLSDASVRLVESNEDTLLYAQGHIPGAVQIDWTKDLNEPNPARLHQPRAVRGPVLGQRHQQQYDGCILWGQK